jgi:hypothetical protein
MDLDLEGAAEKRGRTAVPAPLARDLEELEATLQERGLRGALWFLNARTPHRFTGVFRFDGEMLRSVALVDKWDPLVELGEDVPVASAYCAHLRGTGQPLEVEHGPSDARTPWMSDSAVLSYCGAPILDDKGTPWGAICHFDTSRCEAKNSDMPLLFAAAVVLFGPALTATRPA